MIYFYYESYFFSSFPSTHILHTLPLPSPSLNVGVMKILPYTIFFFFFNLFLAALCLCCCMQAFSSCGEQGLLFVAVSKLLIEVASLVVEHGLQARGLQQLWHMGSVVVAHGLQSAGSVVVAHGLSCSAACGIFPDQGSNPCPLHWQADSQPLRHQGSPALYYLKAFLFYFLYVCRCVMQAESKTTRSSGIVASWRMHHIQRQSNSLCFCVSTPKYICS